MALKKHDVRLPITLSVDDLTEAELMNLRVQVNERLNLSLEDINMKDELALQLRRAQTLYDDTVNDAEIPANQKSQVLNTISSILKAVVDISAEIMTIERHKKIEAATIAAVTDLPPAAKDRFFEVFKGFLTDE